MSSKKVFITINTKTDGFLNKIKNENGLKTQHLVCNTSSTKTNNQNANTSRQDFDYYLYVIIPDLVEYDIIPYLIDDSNKYPSRTRFYYEQKNEDCAFNAHQIKSLNAIGQMVEKNGGEWCKEYNELIRSLKQDPDHMEHPTRTAQKNNQSKSNDTRVFLGGTVNGSTWRDALIEKLNVDYYNPVVSEWNEEARQRELLERINCDYNLYVITPLMIGYYSIAEAVDDSYKKPGQTLYCFLNSDVDPSSENREVRFSSEQLESLRLIGNFIELNGGIWCNSINEVTTFFNKIHDNSLYYQTYTFLLERAVDWNRSNREVNRLMKGFDLADAKNWINNHRSADVIPPSKLMQEFYELSRQEEVTAARDSVFISYSRKASLSYANVLFDQLSQSNVNVWFDKKRIRTGVDFRDEIQVGIERAGNFIFLISPESCASPYCQQELDMAKKFGKRIIPILHRSVNDKDVDQDISSFHREEFDPKKRNDKLEQERILQNVLNTIKSGNRVVKDHTNILIKSLEWDINAKPKQLLLNGNEQIQAYHWLMQCVQSEVPVRPTSLQAEFISVSKREADNQFVDFWISTTGRDEYTQWILNTIQIKGYTTNKSTDVAAERTEISIVKSTRLLFIITPASINDKGCLSELQIARQHNVPIIPIMVEFVDVDQVLTDLEKSHLKDLCECNDWMSCEHAVEEFLNEELSEERAYYTKLKFARHKHYTWNHSVNKQPFLIRGKSIQEYEDWLITYKSHHYVSFEEINAYLQACNSAKDLTTSDIFISYHSEKQHFAFRVNEQLNEFGKVTWNDHTDQTTSVRSEAYSKEGIRRSENIVIIASKHYFDSSDTACERKEINNIGKRVILIKESKDQEIPPDYQNITCIDFSDNFELAGTKLLNELQTDHAYVKKYNEISIAAHTWIKSNRSTTKLLIGDDLMTARSWYRESKDKSPQATPDQEALIVASTNAELKRKSNAKWRMRVLIMLTILAIISTVFSLYERSNAEKAKKEAENNEFLAKSSAKEAVTQKQKALENERIAKKNAEEARLSAEDAKRSKVRADSLKDVAQYKAFIAELRQKQADIQKNIATTQKKNALDAKRKAEMSDSTARVLKQIETGKSLALSTSKLMVTHPDSAKLIAIMAYDTLKNFRSKSTDPILFESLTEVYEKTNDDGKERTNIVEGQAIVAMQVTDDKYGALSENGYFIIRDKYSTATWTSTAAYFQNSSTFTMSNDKILVGDRYGQIHLLMLDSLGADGIIYNHIHSRTQIHEVNNNISHIEYLDIGPQSAFLSMGFDGKVIYSLIEDKVITPLAHFETESIINAVDVDQQNQRIALGTRDKGVYLLDFNLKAHSSKNDFFPSFQQIPISTDVTAIKFLKNKRQLVIGLANGAVKIIDSKDNSFYEIEAIKEHKMQISCIAVGSNKILSGSRDGTIKIREWNDGYISGLPDQILTYRRHGSFSDVLDIHIEGRWMAVSMDNHSIRSWIINIDQLYQMINQKLISKNEY